MKEGSMKLYVNPEGLDLWDEDRDFSTEETVRMLVTPEVARLMLLRNLDARPWRPWRTQWFEKQIRLGRFRDTGQGLVFFKTGVLGDGQHRLYAIENTGVPQVMRVSFGVDESARDVLDMPLKRTRGDVLAQRGELSYNELAAALKLTRRYLIGHRQGTGGRYEVDDMLADLERWPDIRDYVNVGQSLYRRLTGLVPSAATVAAYLSGEEPDLTNPWYVGLLEGTDRYELDPRTVLERQLAKARDKDPIRMVALYGRAYNYWLEEKGVKNLAYRPRQNNVPPEFGRVAELRAQLLGEEGLPKP